MSAKVRVGERGFDSSFSHPPVARTLQEGFGFRVGYISVPPASPGKNITIAECVDTVNAGQKLLLVYEMDAARPNLGATYGAIDGKNAALCAAALRCPTDVPILSAADLNTFFDNIDRHEAYMRAFAANCGPWPMGIYGDTDILARCAGLWRVGWVPLGAWAWSGTSYANAKAKAKAVGAHVLQAKGYYIDNTWAVDPNEAIADFPAWGLGQPTPPGGDDMRFTQDDILKAEESPGDKFVLMANGRLRAISAAELRVLAIPLTVELGRPVSKADRDALGSWTDPSTPAPGPIGPLHIEATLVGTAS